MDSCLCMPLQQRTYTSLSGGEKKRVHIAKAVLQLLADHKEESILLLDEPFCSLDLYHQHHFMKLFQSFTQQGTTLFIIMHDLNMVNQYMDYLFFMKAGSLLHQGTPQEVLTPKRIASLFQVKATTISSKSPLNKSFIFIEGLCSQETPMGLSSSHLYMHVFSDYRPFSLKTIKRIACMLAPMQCYYCNKPLNPKDPTEVCLTCIKQFPNHLLKNQKTCPTCYHPLQGKRRCPRCSRNKIYPNSIKNTSVFANDSFPQQFFYDYKFRRKRSYIPIVAACILEHYGDSFLRHWDAYVPVTLNRKDLFVREFCPVLAITKVISKHTKIPIVRAIIKKPKRNAKAQHQKTMKERLNILHNFAPNPTMQPFIKDKRVLIIDDIFTTGSTVNTYSHLLHETMQPQVVESFTFLQTLTLNTDQSKGHKITPSK